MVFLMWKVLFSIMFDLFYKSKTCSLVNMHGSGVHLLQGVLGLVFLSYDHDTPHCRAQRESKNMGNEPRDGRLLSKINMYITSLNARMQRHLAMSRLA